MAASTVPLDTGAHISALMSSLQHFQYSGSYTDLTLQAEEGEVRCHKAVLAPFSPLLWDLCHMEEETVILLPGVGLQEVQHLVSQFYTGFVNHSEHSVALARLLKLDVPLQSERKCQTEDIGKKENQVSWTEGFLGFMEEKTDPVKSLLKENIETVSSAANRESAAMFFKCQLCERSDRYVSEMRNHYCRSHLLGDLKAEYANLTDGRNCKLCGKRFSSKLNLYCHIGVKHNKFNNIMVKRGLYPLPLRMKTKPSSRHKESRTNNLISHVKIKNEVVMKAENYEQQIDGKSPTFQNMINNLQKMVKKEKSHQMAQNNMVKKRRQEKHQKGIMNKHMQGLLKVDYSVNVEDMLMERNTSEEGTGLSQKLLEPNLLPIMSSNKVNHCGPFINSEALKGKAEEIMDQPEINCQIDHKEEVELAFTVSKIEVKKLVDKAGEGGRREETALCVWGEKEKLKEDVKIENVPGGEEVSSLEINQTSQVKLQRPRKLLDGTPILDVKFLTEKGLRPTTTYDDNNQVKQESVSTLPAVEEKHPYSQDIKGGQELAGMEEGIVYKQENYATVDTGGKPKKELSSYITSEGLGHICSLCARSFSKVRSCKRHIKEKHLGLGRNIKRCCPHCNKEVTKRYIKEHIVSCKLANSNSINMNVK